MLIYGGIYRPTAERAEFPDGEGLLTFDLATGASTFKHIAIYGNENTAGDFNADHMAGMLARPSFTSLIRGLPGLASRP